MQTEEQKKPGLVPFRNWKNSQWIRSFSLHFSFLANWQTKLNNWHLLRKAWNEQNKEQQRLKNGQKHKNWIFPDKNWCKRGEKQDYFNLCKRWRSLPATMARLTWLIHDQICIGDKTRNNVILSFLVRKKTIWKYLCVSYFPALLNWAKRTDSKKRRWKFLGRISLGYFPNCKKKRCYLKYILLLTMTKKRRGKMPCMIKLE